MSEQTVSSLEQAVSLACWLIRTGRQPPGKANFIAARKHRVDMGEVARRVGQRGGRSSSADRKRADVRPVSEPLPPAEAPWPGTATFEVVEMNETSESIYLVLRALHGFFVGQPLTFHLPTGWMPSVTPGSHILFQSHEGIGPEGPTIFLDRFVAIASTRGP